MGVTINCVNTGKCCSCETWFRQRVDIIIATIDYLEIKIAEVETALSKYDQEQDEVFPIENSRYDAMCYRQFIRDLRDRLIEPIRSVRDKYAMYAGPFDILCSAFKYIGVKPAMIAFGVYGIYPLCAQSDVEGAYSVGNSYDIIELLLKLEPTIEKSSELYDVLYIRDNDCTSPILAIFKDSFETRQPVRIS